MASKLFNFKNFFSGLSSKKATTIILVLGLAGIALLFLSEFIGQGSNSSGKPNSSSATTQEYEAQIEHRLEEIIGQINGVGRVKVLVTIESGVENVYETDNKGSADETKNGGDSSGQVQQSTTSESSHVIIDDGNGGQKALLTTQLQPKILGVVVVCDGGNNPDVKENVIDSVSTALGVPTNRISVNKMQPKN